MPMALSPTMEGGGMSEGGTEGRWKEEKEEMEEGKGEEGLRKDGEWMEGIREKR